MGTSMDMKEKSALSNNGADNHRGPLRFPPATTKRTHFIVKTPEQKQAPCEGVFLLTASLSPHIEAGKFFLIYHRNEFQKFYIYETRQTNLQACLDCGLLGYDTVQADSLVPVFQWSILPSNTSTDLQNYTVS
jgi:hypothetical protein